MVVGAAAPGVFPPSVDLTGEHDTSRLPPRLGGLNIGEKRKRGRKLRLRRIKGHRSGFYWEPHDEVVTFARKDGKTTVMQRSREMVTEIHSLTKNPDKVSLLKFCDAEGRRGELFFYRSALDKNYPVDLPRFQLALSDGLVSLNQRDFLRVLFRLFNKLHPKRQIRHFKGISDD